VVILLSHVNNVDGSISQLVQIQNRTSHPITLINMEKFLVGQRRFTNWQNVDNFSSIAVSVASAQKQSIDVTIHWSYDGTNFHSFEKNNTDNFHHGLEGNFIIEFSTKAPFCRIEIHNTADTEHFIGAWMYVKA
jgi:hypothetical protein